MHLFAMLLAPTIIREVPYSQLADMDFVRPQKKQSEPCYQYSLSATASKPAVAEPTTIELQCLYKDLSAAGKPVFLSLVPRYSDFYIPMVLYLNP